MAYPSEAEVRKILNSPVDENTVAKEAVGPQGHVSRMGWKPVKEQAAEAISAPKRGLLARLFGRR